MWYAAKEPTAFNFGSFPPHRGAAVPRTMSAFELQMLQNFGPVSNIAPGTFVARLLVFDSNGMMNGAGHT
jgi:hypothetical protein